MRIKELEEYKGDNEDSAFVKEELAMIEKNNIFKILQDYCFDFW